MANPNDIDQRLINANYTYKKTMGGLDNALDNAHLVRVYRDNSTEIFTNVMIGQEGVPPANRRDGTLGLFLDYTFHRLYAEVITNIDMKLIDAIPIDFNNREIHIKPLVGVERLFLIFKGGTLMKNYFDDYIDQVIDNAQNFTSNDIRNKYQNINITDLIFNIDANQNINPDANNPDEVRVFKNRILKPNFKISDTDYSMFINSTTNERFLVIHKYAIQLLGKAFERMTGECDEYYNNVINNRPINANIPAHYNQSNETLPLNPHNVQLLNTLRIFLDDNQNVINIIGAPNVGALNALLNAANLMVPINVFLQQFWRPINNLYDCYNNIAIISLLRYIFKLNNIFQNAFNILYGGNNPANDVNLAEINRYITVQIEIYINIKFRLLKNNQFYTNEKLDIVKQRLVNYYTNIPAGDPLFNPKFEAGDDPRYITKKIDRYQLDHNNLNNPNLVVNDIVFAPRHSSLLVTNNNAIVNVILTDIDRDKNHYVSYNESIRKVRGQGLSTVDFDLMRSKFNIVLNKVGAVTLNGQPHMLKIPSEFIDVSIPRFDDLSRIGFFEHIQHHGFEPVKLDFPNVPNNQNTAIYSYSCSEVLEDLLYTLFSQNQFEPWLDKKYGKRILRSIVLLIIIIRYEQQLNRNLPQAQQDALFTDNLNTYVELFELCFAIEQYIGNIAANPGVQHPYPYHIVARYLDGYDHANPNNPNNRILEEFLRSIRTFKRNWLHEKQNRFNIFIHERYTIVKALVKNLILWSFLYEFNNNDLINGMNHLSLHYLQTPLYMQIPPVPNGLNDINYARNSFGTMIRMVYDYGFKLLYLVDNHPGQRNINLAPPANPLLGGNNSYYEKYLKYKQKYLLK